MTPREVDALTAEEYDAMTAYAVREQREEQRALRQARKRGR